MKKFTKKYVYYGLVWSIIPSLFFSFFFSGELFSSENEDFDFTRTYLISSLVVFLVVYLFLILYHYLYIRTSGYVCLENEIRCKRGIIFKKNSVVEYKKMHAINKKQNFIQKWFDIAILTIDSGSTNTASKAEIIIIETEQVVDQLLMELKEKQSGEKISDIEDVVDNRTAKELFTFSSRSKMIYSGLNVLMSLFSILLIAIITWIGLGICLPYIKFNGDLTIGSFLIIGVFTTISFILFIGCITFIGSILLSFVKYYQFKISRIDNELQICYGLFVKNDNRFQLDKIKAIKIHQNIIQRIFHFSTIYLEVVGYCESTNQNNHGGEQIGILIPLCKESSINDILEKVLPSYVPLAKEEKAKSFAAFILWPFLLATIGIMFPTLLIMIVFLILNVSFKIYLFVLLGACAFLVLIYLYILVVSLFAYHNHGLTINEEKLTIYNGSITRKETVILKQNVIAIEDITTPKRKKKGIYSFRIHFFTNATTNVVSVKHIDERVAILLQNILTY